MSTQAQITANRLNAQSSTGPKSSIGKAIAARNNLRHGFTGAFLVLHWEEESEYQSLFASLQSEHQPITPTEKLLVEKMAQSEWLRKRAVFLQATCFDYTSPSCQGQEKQLALYLRYQTTHERAFHKALNTLIRLQQDRRKSQSGFVSPSPEFVRQNPPSPSSEFGFVSQNTAKRPRNAPAALAEVG